MQPLKVISERPVGHSSRAVELFVSKGEGQLEMYIGSHQHREGVLIHD